MIGLVGQDSSFFEAKMLQVDDASILLEDVLSLTVTEAINEPARATITLNDFNCQYANILRELVEIELSWGYRPSVMNIQSMGDSFSGGIQRRGLKMNVLNPQGMADERGVIQFSCNMVSSLFKGQRVFALHENTTKGALVQTLFTKIGVVTAFVLFEEMTKPYMDGGVERQEHTDIQFLAMLAKDWRCALFIGHSAAGVPVGAFVDPDKISLSMATQSVLGVPKNQVELNYRAGDITNVINYSWQDQQGDNGSGDNAQIVWIGGQPTIRRRTVTAEGVKTWVLSPAAVTAEKEKRKGDMRSLLAWLTEIIKATDLTPELLKKYFVPVDQTTAPNGFGYTLRAHLFGSPALMPFSEVMPREGFPARLRIDPNWPVARPLKFYARSVTHTLNKTGYFTDLEAVDVYTLAPTGMMM